MAKRSAELHKIIFCHFVSCDTGQCLLNLKANVSVIYLEWQNGKNFHCFTTLSVISFSRIYLVYIIFKV